MKVIRLTCKVRDGLADSFIKFKQAHSDINPSDAQMAEALIASGLAVWERLEAQQQRGMATTNPPTGKAKR